MTKLRTALIRWRTQGDRGHFKSTYSGRRLLTEVFIKRRYWDEITEETFRRFRSDCENLILPETIRIEYDGDVIYPKKVALDTDNPFMSPKEERITIGENTKTRIEKRFSRSAKIKDVLGHTGLPRLVPPIAAPKLFMLKRLEGITYSILTQGLEKIIKPWVLIGGLAVASMHMFKFNGNMESALTIGCALSMTTYLLYIAPLKAARFVLRTINAITEQAIRNQLAPQGQDEYDEAARYYEIALATRRASPLWSELNSYSTELQGASLRDMGDIVNMR